MSAVTRRVIKIGSALLVVTMKDIIRCGLAMIVCFGALAGIYVIMGAPLLGAAQVIVYIGAISVLILFAIGTSLITPLIPIYQEELGFNDTVVALFMLCYVVALVPSMLTLGQVSDRIGRKPVLLAALATLPLIQPSSAMPDSVMGLLESVKL